MSTASSTTSENNAGGEARVLGAKTVFSDYASMLGARFASIFLSLLSVFLTTRLLGPRGYGTLAYFIIISLLIFTVTSAWTSTAVSRYGREEIEGHGSMTRVTWNRLVINVPLYLISALVVITLKEAGSLPREFSWTLVSLSLAYGAVWIASDHLIYALESSGRMKLSALGALAQQAVIVIALAVILVIGFSRSASVVAALSLVVLSGLSLVLAALLWRIAVWPPAWDRQLFRRMLMLSIPLIAFTASQYIVRSVDIVVIRAERTTSEVGVYALAYQGYTVLSGLAAAAPPVLIPLFVSLRVADKESAIRRYLDRAVPLLMFLSAVAGAVAVPFVSFLVPKVFGASFAASARPMVILIVAVILLSGASLLAPILVLHERSRAIAGWNVLAAITNIVGDIVLIGPVGLGIAGAAVSTAAAVGIIFGGYVFTARRASQAPVTLPPSVLLPLVAAVIPALIWTGALSLGIGLACAVASTLCVVLFMNPFAAGDADLIANLDMPPRMRRAALRGLALAMRDRVGPAQAA